MKKREQFITCCLAKLQLSNNNEQTDGMKSEVKQVVNVLKFLIIITVKLRPCMKEVVFVVLHFHDLITASQVVRTCGHELCRSSYYGFA